MRNHDIRSRQLEPRRHCHDAATALAFHRAPLTGQGSVTRLRGRLAAADRDDDAQGVGEVIVAHLDHLRCLFVSSRVRRGAAADARLGLA